jgi:hypothetical protein
MGIHPGLHAEGVFEFWEPTLDLLLEEGIVTVFTMFSEEEYLASVDRLDGMFAKYVLIIVMVIVIISIVLSNFGSPSAGTSTRGLTLWARPTSSRRLTTLM